MTDGVRVLTKPCQSCIFHPGNLMHLRNGGLKEMVDECRQRDWHVICHETMQGLGGNKVAGPGATGAVCRGYWNHVMPRSGPLQAAERLGLLEWIDPPAVSEFMPVEQ